MEPIRFIHMSDIHFREAYAPEGFESILAGLPHPRRHVLDAIAAERDHGLDFVLLTGDIAHEGDMQDYLAVRQLFAECLGAVPLVTLPGNHDRIDGYTQVFSSGERETLNRTYEIAGLRIVTVYTGDSKDGEITLDQLSWLRQELSVPSARGTILALHHPLLAQNGLDAAKYDPALLDIIAQSDIVGIFTGHTHANFIGLFADKPYITADSMMFSMDANDGMMTLRNHAAYTLCTLVQKTLSAEVKLVAPISTVTTRFSIHLLSQSERK